MLVIALGCTQSTKTIHRQTMWYDSAEATAIATLDSLNKTHFYDLAKWRLYTIQCNDSSAVGENKGFNRNLSRTPLAFLPLKLTYVSVDSSEVSLYCTFIADDSTYVVETSAPERAPIGGVVFDRFQDTIKGFIVGHGIFNESGSSSRFNSSLQPKIKDFLVNNIEKLDPWLYQQMKLRCIVP